MVTLLGSSHVDRMFQMWETSLQRDNLLGMQVRYFGLPGATSPQLLTNDDFSIALTLHKPEFLALILGGNDCDSNIATDQLINNLQTLLTKYRPFTQHLLFVEIIQRHKTRSRPLKVVQDRILHTNQTFSVWCQTNNIHFVSLARTQIQQTHHLNNKIFLPDGVHLTHKGYRRIFTAISQKIREILGPNKTAT